MWDINDTVDKLLWIIEKLPVDQIVIIADKCKWWWETSPKVKKLLNVFEKLSDEEKQQFLNNIKPIDGDNAGIDESIIAEWLEWWADLIWDAVQEQ